jgi:hypothetical protein
MWYYKNNILLKEAGEDGAGGAGGSEATILEDQFSDADDFNLSGLAGEKGSEEAGGGEQPKDKEGNIINIPEDQESPEEIARIEEEAKEKGITVDELKTQKSEEAFSKEAEEKGITVDELKTQKEEAQKAADEKQAERDKEIETLEEKLKKEKKSEDEIKKAVETKRQEFVDADFDDEINPFGGYKGSEQKSEETKTVDIDYNELANEIGYEVEEGVEIKSMDEFKEISKSNLEKAKKTFDLSEYPPEAQMVLENLKKNNTLQLTDFYRNDTIRSIDNFLALDNKTKLTSVLAEDAKKEGITDKDQLSDYVADKMSEMTEDDIQDRLKIINREATSIKTKEFGKIIAEKNKFIETQNEKAKEEVQKERKTLVKTLKETTKFMGFPIPDNVITIMAKEIESGQFQDALDENVAQTKINAYIVSKLGKQFETSFAKMLKKARGESYQKGTETIIKQKHNIKSGGGPSGNKRTSSDLSFSDDTFEDK